MASEGQDRADALGWGRRPNRPKTFARYHTIPRKVTTVSIYDKDPGRPEGCSGQITYSTRCNDDTARERTRFPPRRPATRPRARGSASRRSTSKLLARALERRSAPLRYRRDPR